MYQPKLDCLASITITVAVKTTVVLISKNHCEDLLFEMSPIQFNTAMLKQTTRIPTGMGGIPNGNTEDKATETIPRAKMDPNKETRPVTTSRGPS
jgi:hypothetical protein